MTPHQDRGYAWVILFCNFLWYFVIAGTLKSFGVLYVDLMELFQAGYLATSLISTIFTIVWCITAPLMGYLVDRVSPRLLTFVGGLLAGAATTSCAFAPTVTFIIFVFGVIGGLSVAMMEPAILATLTRYFKRRLGLANGIAYSGEGLGAMTLPLIMTATTEVFTVRGTLLILGGIWFNCCVIGALLRPPPQDPSSTSEALSPSKASQTDGDQSRFESSNIQDTHRNASNSQSLQDIDLNGGTENQDDLQGHKYSDLLKNTQLLRIIAMLFCGGLSSYGVMFIFPALALELGSTKMYSSLTVSVAGACEVISKLSVGVVMDTKILSKHTIAAVLFLIAGAGAVIAALLRDTRVLMGYAVVLGLTGLNFPCLAGPLLTDCVRSQALGGAMGLYLFAYGAGIAIGYPIIGATRTYFGSYAESLMIFGGFYIGGALVSLYDVPAWKALFSRACMRKVI